MISLVIPKTTRFRTLVLSTLYPNVAQPRHGIFIENRIRSQVESGQIEVRVVAPVPWFPFRHRAFGHYATVADVPKRDQRHGINIVYPKYPVVPKFGMTIAPALLAASLIAPIRNIIRSGFDFDVLDCYYFYPDGVAAALIGKYFKKPIVTSALGTDINLIPKYYLPRRMIQWAADQNRGMTAVCRALKDEMVALGVADERVRVVLHGVDLQLFQPPQDRDVLRKSLNLNRRTLLSVGHLIERKGHHIAIEALKYVPEVELLIAGDGPEQASLKSLAHQLQVESRVRFLGHVDQTDLRRYYGGADALVLASSREGIANVLLESMACGTPVIATRVWGAPEVITQPEAGVLVDERTPECLAESIRKLFANYPDRKDTRRFVEQYSWKRTTDDHFQIFDEILSHSRSV